MDITSKQIKSLKPCKEGLKWYLKNAKHITDLEELLISINAYDPGWSRWLFTELMDKNQCIQIAIFAADQVLYIFEAQYPDDDRPRRAIEATKRYLKSHNITATYAAADAAAAAADAYGVADAKKELQIKIIKEAVRILED